MIVPYFRCYYSQAPPCGRSRIPSLPCVSGVATPISYHSTNGKCVLDVTIANILAHPINIVVTNGSGSEDFSFTVRDSHGAEVDRIVPPPRYPPRDHRISVQGHHSSSGEIDYPPHRHRLDIRPVATRSLHRTSDSRNRRTRWWRNRPIQRIRHPSRPVNPEYKVMKLMMASSAPCSGIFDVSAAVRATTTNDITVVVPPQPLIQVLYGESKNVVGLSGTATAQILMEALGNTIGNRYMDPQFSPSTSWQDLITQAQFAGLAGGLNQTAGVEPELDAAADVFSQSLPISSVQNATCFFSPTTAGWIAIQQAQAQNVTTVSSVTFDPGCYVGNTRQFIVKSSAGTRSSQVPYFIFVQAKQSNAPAIITIP